MFVLHFQHYQSWAQSMQRHFALVLWFFVSAAGAQTQYSSDLSASFDSFRSLMTRAERTSLSNKAGLLAIQAEAFELHKKAASIGSEAAQAELALVRSGEPHDKNLLLVSAAADALVLAKKLLDYYLFTGDKAFLSQATAVAQIGRRLKASVR